MRSAPDAPRPVSHFSGWISNSRPLIALLSEFCFRNCRTEMLPAELISVLFNKLNLSGGSSSLLGHTEKADDCHTEFSRALTSARICAGVAVPHVPVTALVAVTAELFTRPGTLITGSPM